MSKTILITRPREQAQDFARDLHALGFQTLIEPMLEIIPVPFGLPDLTKYDAIIFTSANAVRQIQTDLPVYAVGEQTRASAQTAGFTNITTANGNASDLAGILDSSKTYLHLRGKNAAYEFPSNIESLITYEAQKAEKLSDQTIAAIKNKSIGMIVFFSARTAENFITLARNANLKQDLESINSLSISEDVLKCVRVCAWKGAYVAKRPDGAGMIETLKRWSETMSNSNEAMYNAEAIIERFGGIRPMATKTNIPVTTIQGWKKRGTIPGTRTAEIIAIAGTHNIDLADILSAPKPTNFANENTQIESVALAAPIDTIAENTIIQTLENRIKDMESRAVMKSAIISALLILIAAIALIAIFWPAQRFESEAERLSALEQQFTPEERAQPTVTEAMSQKFADLKLQAQTAAGEAITQSQAAVEAYIPLNTEALMARFNDLKQSVSGEEQLNATIRDLATHIASLPNIQGDAEINAVLANAKQQSATVAQTLEGVPQQDLKAAAMLLALTQFRTSLNRNNQPFENDLMLLKTLAGEKNTELQASLDNLAPYAQSGVLTPAGLQTEFKTLTGEVIVASLSGEDVSMQERARARMNELFELQKNGELVTGTQTQATLVSAENLLAEGNIESAIAQLKSLQGNALTAATPFIQKAQATLSAQRAQQIIAQIPGFGPTIKPYDFNRN